MDDKLPAKTAKCMSLENLYVYGNYSDGTLKKLGNTHVHSKDIRTIVSYFIRAFPSVHIL